MRLFSKAEAKEFVSDLLRLYRCNNYVSSDNWHPFDEACVDSVIAFIETKGLDMKPRTINDLLGRILLKYNAALVDGSLKKIGKAEASSVLSTTTILDEQKE